MWALLQVDDHTALYSLTSSGPPERAFKEHTSFSELLAHVQEEYEKNSLRNNDASIAQISDRLGYAEPAAFNQWIGAPRQMA